MHRYIRLALVAALAVLATLLAGGTASAASVTPTLVTGNPTCTGLKIEPVTSGTYGPVTITVSGSSFSFTSSDPISSVTVKGGPNANIYTYSPSVTSDTDLTAPINPNTGKPYGLSHLCFTVDDNPYPYPS